MVVEFTNLGPSPFWAVPLPPASELSPRRQVLLLKRRRGLIFDHLAERNNGCPLIGCP
jgi:hypothetical protein